MDDSSKMEFVKEHLQRKGFLQTPRAAEFDDRTCDRDDDGDEDSAPLLAKPTPRRPPQRRVDTMAPAPFPLAACQPPADESGGGGGGGGGGGDMWRNVLGHPVLIAAVAAVIGMAVVALVDPPFLHKRSSTPLQRGALSPVRLAIVGAAVASAVLLLPLAVKTLQGKTSRAAGGGGEGGGVGDDGEINNKGKAAAKQRRRKK
jgi:hypothetical protein